MNELNAHQADVTGCLLKLALFVLTFGLFVIFSLGILAGMVIASGF